MSALLALLILGTTMPASVFADGFPISVSAFMPYFECTYNWQWKSVVDHILGVQNGGTFDHCFGIVQIGTLQANGTVLDGDSQHDTYIGYLVVDWDTTTSYLAGGNPMKAKISSSVTASTYAAAPITISGSACQPVSLGFNLGVIGVSLNEALCNDATLKRDSYNATSAQWSASDVKNVPHMSFTYLVKVGQGVKPTFTATTTYPYYTKFKDGGTYYGMPTWGYTVVMYGSTWVHKAP